MSTLATTGLKGRVRVAEIMDDPRLGTARHLHALDALARINRFSLTAGRVWREVRALAAQGVRPVRVLDLACGGGDVVWDVARRARQFGTEVELCGCDRSSVALERARRRAADGTKARFVQLDALDDNLPGTFDLTTCSLFLHHLDAAEAVHVLAAMASITERVLLIQDLRRTALGLMLARAALPVLTTSDVARHDGMVSVRAAFTLDEARSLADTAGLTDALIRPCWPQSFTMRWARS